MNLFESQGVKGQERTSKFAIAYIRVLWQAAEFLEAGKFKCQIDDPKLREFLMAVKPLSVADLQQYIPRLTEMFMEMQKRVTDAYASPKLVKLKPDIDWIEEFIHEAYLCDD